MTGLEFATLLADHWFLVWCSLWLVWPAAWVPVALATLISNLFVRVLRAIVVLIRGWPPAHLDADGDRKP